MTTIEQEINRDSMQLLQEQAAVIIHEIRSPIQALKAQLQIMERQLHQQDEHGQDLRFAMMQNTLNSMNDLLSQFLAMGKMPGEEKTALHLPTVAAEMLLLLRALCIKGGIHAEVENRMLPPVFANEQSVRRILMNLIINAVQAMEESGHELRITFDREDGMQIMTVENDGPMITADPIDKVFEARYTTKKDGNGLGLYGCRQLAESHGGSLTVESTEEKTAFRLALPEEAV